MCEWYRKAREYWGRWRGTVMMGSVIKIANDKENIILSYLLDRFDWIWPEEMFNGWLWSFFRFGFLESFGGWGFGHLLVDMLLGGLGLDVEEVVDGAGIVPVAEGAEEVPVVGVVIAGWGDGCLCLDPFLFFFRLPWFFFALFLALLFHFFEDSVFAVAHILFVLDYINSKSSLLFPLKTKSFCR